MTNDNRPTFKLSYIRAWREHRGLTQDAVAQAAGVSRSILVRIERGERRYNQDVIEKVAAALRVRPGDLLSTDPATGGRDELDTLDAEERELLLKFLRLFRDGRRQDGTQKVD